MKKIIIVLLAILSIIIFDKTKADNIIPKEAIRLRVIANSNSKYDQNMKMKVSKTIQDKLYNLLKETKGIEEARKKIKNNINTLDYSVKKILKEENYPLGYTIHYGDNYFPKKEYKGIKYEAGYYESLLITLGDGKGKNWWCVLFPPLCLIEAEESDKVEYKSFIKEIIDKYF